MESLFIKKLLLSVFLGFSVITFSFAKSISSEDKQMAFKPKGRESSESYDSSFPNPVRKNEELKARGVIVRFHRWPSLKQKKTVAGVLKSNGLKSTRSIRNFKAQLFGWKEGGLRLSKQAEQACVKLKSLSYVRRCSPDHLLSVNSSENASRFTIAGTEKDMRSKETEGGFIFECKACQNQGFKPVAGQINKSLNIRTCNVLSCTESSKELSCEHQAGGELSDYWAQELIGSDLLREELKKTPAPEIENWIAVFDSRIGNHNILVKNLISDEGLHAVLPELRGEKVSRLNTGYGQNVRSDKDYIIGKGYKSALSLYETGYPGDYLFGFKKKAPHYINNSMNWFESEDIYEVFEKLSSSGVSNPIVVLAAGNHFPKRLDDMGSKASRDFDAILVGSFSPKGFVSGFSQSGEELSILAPSDDWIISANEEGSSINFGKTSGATPLVTGSLAGFEWLSGYHPTAKEAKILLEKTALPTLHSHEKPPINGAGLLNAYKLGEVAKRLKEKCKGKSLFCFKEEILKDENYHFTDEDKSLREDLGRVFPSCAGRGEERGAVSEFSGCEEKGELLKKLRKWALLNPARERLKILSCIYKEAGFSKNGEALDKLALALGTEAEVRAELSAEVGKKEPVSYDMLRLMLGMGGFVEEFTDFELERGLRIAHGIGKKALPLLEKGFEKIDNLDLQIKALDSAGKIGVGEKALPLLEKGFATGDPYLQEAALTSAARIGEKGLPLLEKGFATGDPYLQERALTLAARIGEKAQPLLKKVLKYKNLNEKIRRWIERQIK